MRIRKLAVLAVLMISISMWGCEDMFKASIPSSPDPINTISGGEIQGNKEITGKNQQLQLHFIISLSDNTTQDQTNNATWISSNTSVATISNTGLVTSIGFGQADISAIYEMATGIVTLTVNPTKITFQAISDIYSVSFIRDKNVFFNAPGFGGGGRGFSIAAISIVTGELIQPVRNFDTWATRDSGTAMRDMIEFINSIPDNTLLLIAVGDEAGLNPWPSYGSCGVKDNPYNEKGKKLLESLGSTLIRKYCYRDVWAMITIKGVGKKDEKLSSGYNVTVTYALSLAH